MTPVAADPSIIPANEDQRVAAVRRYDVLDTPPDGAFDRLTALAARHFGVPISIVSIVDSDRVWFKSRHGIPTEQVGREPGLCASAILQNDVWLVEDAAIDPRTLANPLVADELGLRFYAGVPLTTSDGFNLGTICVIDREPRAVTTQEVQTLRDLAAVVVDELELRRAARKVVTQEQALREQAQQLAATLRESVLPPRLPEIDGIRLAAFYRPGDPSQVTGDFYDVFPQRQGRWLAALGDVSGRGPAAAAAASLARYVLRAAAVDHDDPAQVLRTVNRVMLAGVDPLADVAHHYSALVATLDVSPERVRATVARAGHEPALVLRRDGRVETLGGGGSLLGWHPDVRFTTETAQLAAGDLLVLYTDGLTEARTEDGFLDRAGLVGLLRANASRPASHLAGALEEALAGLRPGVVDDAAALIVEVGSPGTAHHAS